MKKFIVLLPAFFFLSASFINAFDTTALFRHSEIAEKNSVFVEAGFAPLRFQDFTFPIFPLDARIEYLPPLPLPFSVGLFVKTPSPNLKSFGLRIAYHFDFLDPLTDFYFVYSFDFGFLRNQMLEEFNDTPAPLYFYDFRVGVRRFFNSRIGIAIESGYKFEGVIFLLVVKIN